ncbi:MAG: hypothetical protein AAGM84_03225 [Pseudomonadota bacterium]
MILMDSIASVFEVEGWALRVLDKDAEQVITTAPDDAPTCVALRSSEVNDWPAAHPHWTSARVMHAGRSERMLFLASAPELTRAIDTIAFENLVTPLTQPLDISLPVNGANIYRPEPYEGFVLRWFGPDRETELEVENTVIAHSDGSGVLAFQFECLSPLPFAVLSGLHVLVAGQPAAVSVFRTGGRFMVRIFAQIDQAALDEKYKITLQLPASFGIMPEAANLSGRLMTLAILSFQVRMMPGHTLDTLGLSVPDPSDRPVLGRILMGKTAQVVRGFQSRLIDGDTAYFMDAGTTEGELGPMLYAINTFYRNRFFPRILLATQDRQISYDVYDTESHSALTRVEPFAISSKHGGDHALALSLVTAINEAG